MKRLVRRARRLVKLTGWPVRWGSLRRTSPLSANYGFERGLPVDRYYIRRFVAGFQSDVRGRVLEVQDRESTLRYGADRVTESEILDIDEKNPDATLVADLAEPGSLPRERYDCFLVLQTLQYLRDPEVGLRNAWESLAPGGVALFSVPCASRIDSTLRDTDLWRFTPSGLEALVRRACPAAEIEVVGFGNVLACVAFLMGIAADELSDRELDVFDNDFPLIACARVRKRA